MITKEEFLKALEVINNYKIQINGPYYEMTGLLEKNNLSKSVISKETLLKDADISVRSLNVLMSVSSQLLLTKDISIKELKLGHFEGVKKLDFYRCHNVGRKSFIEIEKIFFEIGIIF